MENKITLTLLANAGVLLDFGGRKVLVDGLYEAPPPGFSPIPGDALQRLMSAEPPFDGIELLFFTHEHPDHYSGRLPELDSAKNAPKMTVKPDGSYRRLRLGDGFEAELLPTRHLDERFADVLHTGIVFSFRGRRILITADTDYTAETFSSLAETELDAVLLNPLFFSALCRGNYFKGRLNAKRYIIYHLPFPQDDSYKMNAALERSLKLWDGSRGEAIPLTECLQTLTL